MPAQENWMPWLDACRLDDTALAESYENTAPEQRACVKQCLALWHGLYGEDSERCCRGRVDETLGFVAHTQHRAAPWALVGITPKYAAPTRLAAALMPAILAKVPLLAVLCVGGSPSQAARVALELAGVEHIFCIDQTAQAERCLREADALLGQGSVVLLHQGELAPVANLARDLSLPLWEERRPPRAAGLNSHTLLPFCHPDAIPEPPYDVCFAVAEAAPLHLAAGMEAYWQHTGLHKEFFRRSSLHLAPCPDGEQQ